MKKTVKIISAMLLTIMLIASISGIVLAAPNIDNTIGSLENPAKPGDTSQLVNWGANIVNVIQVVGIIVAIIVMLVVGIKYMTGSIEQKAEYKKTMIPYIVGAVLLFAGTTIVKILYNTINNNK